MKEKYVRQDLKISNCTSFFRTYSQDDPLQIYISPSPIVPTPPSSPHLELLRQHYAYLLTSQANSLKQNYFHPSTYDGHMTQQYLDSYRALVEQQHPHSYTLVDGTNLLFLSIDIFIVSLFFVRSTKTNRFNNR